MDGKKWCHITNRKWNTLHDSTVYTTVCWYTETLGKGRQLVIYDSVFSILPFVDLQDNENLNSFLKKKKSTNTAQKKKPKKVSYFL